MQGIYSSWQRQDTEDFALTDDTPDAMKQIAKIATMQADALIAELDREKE